MFLVDQFQQTSNYRQKHKFRLQKIKVIKASSPPLHKHLLQKQYLYLPLTADDILCFLPDNLLGLLISVALISKAASFGSGQATWHTRVWWRSGHETPPLLSGLVTCLFLWDVPVPHWLTLSLAMHSPQSDQSDTSQSWTEN